MYGLLNKIDYRGIIFIFKLSLFYDTFAWVIEWDNSYKFNFDFYWLEYISVNIYDFWSTCNDSFKLIMNFDCLLWSSEWRGVC